MKRLVLVLFVFTILAAGTVFADHPGGFGIGVQGGGGGSWEGGGFGFNNGAAATLKLPSLPIFWAASLRIIPDYFFLGISGDKYLIDDVLVKNIGLNWYLGLGLGVDIGIGDILGLGVAARLPIGISWQPISLLEIYLQAVPQLGVAILPGFYFPAGGWGAELGIRFWFN
jgi:hypothetical protein